jgi:hypothetical protein
MPRFYFHLSAPDQEFRDNIGCDVSDLAAAHARALQLADRVMMFSAFSTHTPDLRRWLVKVADDRQRPVLTVIFPARFAPDERRPMRDYGARPLVARLVETIMVVSHRDARTGPA